MYNKKSVSLIKDFKSFHEEKVSIILYLLNFKSLFDIDSFKEFLFTIVKGKLQ